MSYTWTKKIPTKEGWYWTRYVVGTWIAYKDITYITSEQLSNIQRDAIENCEFAGPIEEPQTIDENEYTNDTSLLR